MDFSNLEYAIAGASASAVSGLDLIVRNQRLPIFRSRYTAFFVAIMVTDGVAGCAALLVCQVLNLSTHAAWIATLYGAFVVGIGAKAILGANLVDIPMKSRSGSIKIGLGILFETITSLWVKPLQDGLWTLESLEDEGRLAWALDRVNNRPNLTFKTTTEVLGSYVQRSNPNTRDYLRAKADLDKEIDAATGNSDEKGKIKQIVTFASVEGYAVPIYRLLGRPKRKDRREWRRRVGG
jgi:hypothetical protein